jgi:membrane protease YdiL (CAAX protease family)
VTIGLLILGLALLAWSTYDGQADYASFKLLTETTDRQRRYRSWVVKNFFLFFGFPVLSLLLLHRLSAFKTFPMEFHPLLQRLESVITPEQRHALLSGVVMGILGGAVIGGLILGIVLSLILKKKGSPRKIGELPTIGDIGAIMPRNNAETIWTTLLSLNAGLGEECFFRLLLPLLLVLLLHNLLLSFAIATVIFGLAHIYQGAAGVIVTTILGGIFAVVYLATGNLWLVIALHAGLDVLNLAVRPTILRLISQTPTENVA